MKQTYTDFNLIRLSEENVAVNMDGELILIDNLAESPEVSDSTDLQFVNHPVKLSFSIVIIVLKGTMQFQINLKNHELHENDILVVLKESIGVYRGMTKETKIAVIAFSSEYFQTALQLDATMTLQHRLYNEPLCHLSTDEMKEFMTIYQLMKGKMTETDNPFRKGALLGYTQVLTFNAYRYMLSVETPKSSSSNKSSRQFEIYQQFIKEVQQNYMKERSISYYADKLCMAPKYLSQVIHHASGRLAGEWINDFVILEAKALLKSHKYSIQQVADMLNFANQSFFGRYFKKKVGCSPSEYQKS